MGAYIYAIISVIIVSLISLVGAVPLLIKKRVSKKTLLFLLSVSVGVLMSTVFLNFIPEITEHGYHLESGLLILLGFLVLFIVEKFVHCNHTKKCESGDCGHSHAYNLAPINLIGDGIHNFIDGLVIAGSYVISIPLGIAATISVIFHEVPQEIADFGVLLYSGLSRKKAVIFNLVSAGTAIVGTIIGLVLAERISGFSHFMIPFATGNFLYIAASNLLPQLHRHCNLRDTALHLFAIFLGIGIILLMMVLLPGHAHG